MAKSSYKCRYPVMALALQLSGKRKELDGYSHTALIIPKMPFPSFSTPSQSQVGYRTHTAAFHWAKRLKEELERKPTVDELAEKMGISKENVMEAIRLSAENIEDIDIRA